jgi:hypothetical protein
MVRRAGPTLRQRHARGSFRGVRPDRGRAAWDGVMEVTGAGCGGPPRSARRWGALGAANAGAARRARSAGGAPEGPVCSGCCRCQSACWGQCHGPRACRQAADCLKVGPGPCACGAPQLCAAPALQPDASADCQDSTLRPSPPPAMPPAPMPTPDHHRTLRALACQGIYTRRLRGRRHPLYGVGVTSRSCVTPSPAAASACTAICLLRPMPRRRTDTL